MAQFHALDVGSPTWAAALSRGWVTKWDACLCERGAVGSAHPDVQPDSFGPKSRPLVYLGGRATLRDGSRGNAVFTSTQKWHQGRAPNFHIGRESDCQLFEKPRDIEYRQETTSYVIAHPVCTLAVGDISEGDVQLFGNLTDRALRHVVEYTGERYGFEYGSEHEEDGATSGARRAEVPDCVLLTLGEGTPSDAARRWVIGRFARRPGFPFNPSQMDPIAELWEVLGSASFTAALIHACKNRPYLLDSFLSICLSLFRQVEGSSDKLVSHMGRADSALHRLRTVDLDALSKRASDPELALRELGEGSSIRETQKDGWRRLQHEIEKVDDILVSTEAPPGLVIFLMECLCWGRLDDGRSPHG